MDKEIAYDESLQQYVVHTPNGAVYYADTYRDAKALLEEAHRVYMRHLEVEENLWPDKYVLEHGCPVCSSHEPGHDVEDCIRQDAADYQDHFDTIQDLRAGLNPF